MSAVETMRKAAALMRERAQAATPGPWFTYDGEPWAGDQQVALAYDDGRMSDVEFDDAANPPLSLFYGDVVRKADGAHIASWHPTVAVAVAQVLDAEAQSVEETDPTSDDYFLNACLAVATTYLGQAS